jgi:hypothetical protein
MKKKESTNTFHPLTTLYTYLSHATKMPLFCSQLRANDVLPRVLIFDYLNYYYYYFEII